MITSPLGIICHGGAGTIDDRPAYAAGLAEAIEEGYRLLRQSAGALEVVVAAVRILEDNPLFNAGTGSDLTLGGWVEMDASVMTQEGRFGGVAGLSGVKNPILVAQKVMTETDHLLLCGTGASEFARRMGFEEHDVVTERAKARLDSVQKHGSKYFLKQNQQRFPDGVPPAPDTAGTERPLGTVGAVVRDKHGNLAAATSSGGIAGRMRGRVGDSALPGAGTFAGPSGAVSCTGHGEEIMRRSLARDLVERMTTMPASTALTLVVAESRRRKLAFGAVGFDARGGICYGHTTPDMAYGYKVAERLFMFTEGKRPTTRV
ncbi:isoaspartyl peptidase/L-asparaginase [candidate division WOR-3 bacterium]|nr:isoaspartyl peptidase/L-asparaginase [candidate division WOR-3 bacterium]